MIEISILIAIVINISMFFFGYGKLTQKVNDINRRLDNDIKHHFNQIEARLDRMEDRLNRIEKLLMDKT